MAKSAALSSAASWALEQDGILQGNRYRSEVSSCADLFKLFSGGVEAKTFRGDLDEIDEQSEEDEERLDRRIEKRITRAKLKVKAEAKADKKKAEDPIIPFRTPILGELREFQPWLELRDKARKDLFWLGRDVLKRDLVEHVHQIVCNQFVQKQFDSVYYEGYRIGDVHDAIGKQKRFDENGRPTREMMLLDPRGFYKTTIDGIDCVQWLLNAPDIRILILAGEYILSSAFLSEIKGYFNFPKNSDPTDFHLLFPEYVLRGLAGESDQPLWCPVRKHLQKEASVWTNAIMASLSGWHCDIRKGDDVVTDRNCTTIELRHTLKEKYDGTDNLVDEWGLSDHIGTRYYTDDWYGTRIDKSKEEEAETALKYFCRQCWIVKPEYTTVPLKQLTSDMVVLNFPEKATFTSLRRKLLNNEKSFRNQQLNEPLEDDVALTINFDEESLRKHVYRFEQAPKVGDIYILWDTALTANKRSDFSSGVVGRIAPQEIKNDDGVVVETRYSLIILEIIYGKFSQSELAVQIVALAKKWKPKKTVIERLPGTELFQREVAMRATQFGVSLGIYFYPPSLEPNAKRNRIHGLEILLKEDRLWFVAGPWIEETFFQLRRYTGEKKNRGRKDDIADAMSSLPMFLPSTMQNEVLRVMQEKEREAAMKKAEYDRIFGGATTLTPINVSSPQTTKSTYVRGPFGIPGFRSRGNVNGGN